MEEKEKNFVPTTKYNLLWYGYVAILILLIISLYYNVQLGSNAKQLCDKKYKPLLEQLQQDPLFNYEFNLTIEEPNKKEYIYKELYSNGSLSEENYKEEQIKWP